MNWLAGLIDAVGGFVSGPPSAVKPTPAAVTYSLATRDSTIRVQERLTDLGYLDPPADGGWGPVSKWALAALCKRAGVPFTLDALTPAMSLALARATPLTVNPGTDLAGRIIKTMIDFGDWIARHPDCVNVVYVEGHNPDGTLNDNKPDQFNDIRCVIRIGENGVPKLEGVWEATTEPGVYWTQHRMNPEGAFHIKSGQYKAWSLGAHHSHEAWVQTGEIAGYRDADNEMIRNMRHLVFGSDFGVNQHWGYDLPRNALQNSSAGCLVGRSTAGHREFMRITKADARFRASPSYRIMTTVLLQSEI